MKQFNGIEGRVVEKNRSKKLSEFMTGVNEPYFLKPPVPFIVSG